MTQYFPKLYEPFGGDINVKVDLSNYATKADLKNATVVNKSPLASKSDLAIWKTKVDKIDVEQLKTVPVDLSKLSNVVNNYVVKRTVNDKLVAKVNNTHTSAFVLKKKLNMQQINHIYKIKSKMQTKEYLILVDLLKKQIVILKLLK